MRLSTRPLTGTVSANGLMECSSVQRARVAAAPRRAVARRAVPHRTSPHRTVSGIRILLFMTPLLGNRWFDQDFGLGPKIDDLEAERIPSARLGILRRIR